MQLCSSRCSTLPLLLPVVFSLHKYCIFSLLCTVDGIIGTIFFSRQGRFINSEQIKVSPKTTAALTQVLLVVFLIIVTRLDGDGAWLLATPASTLQGTGPTAVVGICCAKASPPHYAGPISMD